MMRCTRLTTIVAGLTVAVMGQGLLAQETKKPEETKPTQPPSVVQPKKAEKKPDAPAPVPAKEQLVYVQLQTSMGDILLELNQTKAPISVANFMHYVDSGHYNGTIFHRVINGFMIQGGGFTATMEQKKTDDPIKNEYTNGLKNENYTIAMARLGRRPDSATSQFFINVADNGVLDQPRDGAGYAVFGKVVDTASKDVVNKIKAVKTGAKQTPQGQMVDVPIETVTINTAKRLSEDEATKIKNGSAKPETKPAVPAANPETGKPAEPKKPEGK